MRKGVGSSVVGCRRLSAPCIVDVSIVGVQHWLGVVDTSRHRAIVTNRRHAGRLVVVSTNHHLLLHHCRLSKQVIRQRLPRGHQFSHRDGGGGLCPPIGRRPGGGSGCGGCGGRCVGSAVSIAHVHARQAGHDVHAFKVAKGVVFWGGCGGRRANRLQFEWRRRRCHVGAADPVIRRTSALEISKLVIAIISIIPTINSRLRSPRHARTRALRAVLATTLKRAPLVVAGQRHATGVAGGEGGDGSAAFSGEVAGFGCGRP